MNANIQKAIEIVDGQTALANILSELTGEEVTQQRVRNWLVRGDEVPDRYLAALEAATNGVVSRKVMRPKTWMKIWPELKELDADVQVEKEAHGCVESQAAQAIVAI